MSDARPGSQLWPAARIAFATALLVFVVTIVIGILNGLDVYTPDHDTLMTHVHAGTLGWITLSVMGTAMLIFGDRAPLGAADVAKVKRMVTLFAVAIVLYVSAFFAGNRIWDDRIQRPVFGTLLFIAVIWVAVWLFSMNSRTEGTSVARLGVLLAWVSVIEGAVLGILLGIYKAKGEIPGFGDEAAKRIAEGHPPAMVIGFLILAAMALIEWLLRRHTSWADDRLGVSQMWILFAAGTVANIAFVSGLEEELLGPANLLMIVGVVIMVVRYRTELSPAGWRGSGNGMFARMSSLFLVVYLVLGTILIAQVISGSMDFDALTDEQLGFLLAFDHSMFIGVMTNALFGVLAVARRGDGELSMVDKIVLYGVNVGIIGFMTGLITVSAPLKRTFTPIMGTALLIGIAFTVWEILNERNESMNA